MDTDLQRPIEQDTDVQPADTSRPLVMGDDYGGFLLLNVFDLFLTGFIFRHGGQEVNPILFHVMDRYGMSGAAFFKFALVAVVIVTVEMIHRRKPQTAKKLIHTANLIYFGVILWECVLLLYR